MNITATILDVDIREEAFSVRVAYRGGAKDVIKTLSFAAGIDKTTVQAEINRQGSLLIDAATNAADLQSLKDVPIPVVRVPLP